MDLGGDLAVFLVSWLGDVSAVLLIAIRTYRLISIRRYPRCQDQDRGVAAMSSEMVA